MESTSRSHKKRIKWILICIVVILILPIIGFYTIMTIADINKRTKVTASDYPGSVWESEDPFIHLEVSERSGGGIRGFIWVKGEEKKVILVTTAGRDAKLYDEDMFNQALRNGIYNSNMVLLEVYCKYSEQTIVFKISEDNIYNDQYRIITLTRIS